MVKTVCEVIHKLERKARVERGFINMNMLEQTTRCDLFEYRTQRCACNRGAAWVEKLVGSKSELSTGRMDPRVGSGQDFTGFWRVSTDLLVFHWLFLGT